jgi:hypothetical protein
MAIPSFKQLKIIIIQLNYTLGQSVSSYGGQSGSAGVTERSDFHRKFTPESFFYIEM